VAYLVIAAATLSAGWLSDTLLKRGVSVTRVRKTAVVAGLLGSSIVLPAAFVNSQRLGIVLLYASCVGFGTYTSNHWTITQTLAGPMMAGRWTSVQNGIGNFSGILASWLTGFLVDRHGSFRLAFLIAAGFAVGGAALWGFVVGPVQQVRWRRDDALTT
jgi:MFS transporter, ACS family, D-galactonate transporter